MKRETAYNLYREVERFKEEMKKQGFEYELDAQISKKARKGILYIGQIVDNRFLVVNTSQRNIGDRRYDRAISKLQKLAREFEAVNS